jgi:hypothetical protein
MSDPRPLIDQNNLGDVYNVAAARENLGIYDAENFLFANSNLSDVANAEMARFNLGITEIESVLIPENNLSDVVNNAIARTNLGLGTVLYSENNLLDVGNFAIARENLGIGIANSESVAAGLDDILAVTPNSLLQPLLTLASNNLCDLYSVNSTIIQITGTNNISNFGNTSPVGMVKKLWFTDALTLVSSRNLVLRLSGNVTTANGDVAEFYCFDVGKWKLLSYLTF